MFAAIPGIGNVLVVSLLFWLIFSILGVQLFSGKFQSCVDSDGKRLPVSLVPNKTECLRFPEKCTWRNSDVNFDNVVNGFLTLFQVVSYLFYTHDQCRSILLLASPAGIFREEIRALLKMPAGEAILL